MRNKKVKRQTISLCMIVKNEEAILGRCLSCIKDYVDEIVIVDTGSTDHTVKIAKNFTDKVYHFKWCDDFSAARNFSLSKASKKWVLTLDADEFLNKPELLRRLVKSDKGIFCFKRINFSIDYGKLDDKKYIKTRLKTARITPDDAFFKNNSKLKYVGTVHERLVKDNNIPISNYPAIKIFNLKDIKREKAKIEYYNVLGSNAIRNGDKNCNVFVNLLDFYMSGGKFLEFGALLEKYPSIKIDGSMSGLCQRMCTKLVFFGRFNELKKFKLYLKTNQH
jgi:glycosyltransferase involved in cell wall biosynthesis